MNEVFFLCTAILFSSVIIGALVYGLAISVKSLREWPMLWSSAIVTIFASSVLATAFFMSPELRPADSLNLSALHAPLGPIEVLEWNTRNVEASPEQFGLDITTPIATVYLIGVALFLLRLINGRLRAFRVAMQARRSMSDQGIEYWVTSHHVSPYVIRLFGLQRRFKIVLPQSLLEELDDTQIHHILTHELAHVKRRDDELGLILRVLLTFTWFTPVTHLLFSRWSQSIEVVCDQVAIEGTAVESRRDYANTLLKTLKLNANLAPNYPVTSFSTNRLRDEKMRIKSILQGGLSTFKSLPYRLLVIGSASGLTLCGAMLLSSNTASAAADCRTKKQATVKNGQYLLAGRLTADYGRAPDPFKKGQHRDHKGVDIAAPAGTPIYAPENGTIIAATDVYDEKPKYGKVVIIETNGNTKTFLSHLENYQVEVGQQVTAGTAIATVGSTGANTGPHVHIETFKAGERVDPKTVWQIAH